jgi:hypothetical protein
MERLSELTRQQLQTYQAADCMRALSALAFGESRPGDYYQAHWPRTVHADLVAKHFADMGHCFLERKAGVAAGTTSDGTWAGPLIAPTLVGGFLPLVKAASVLSKLAVTPSPFNVKLARQTAGSSTSWQGEGTVKPVSKLAFDNVTLPWSKCSSIVVVTEELIKLTQPGSIEQLQQTIKDEVVVFVDKHFLSTTAAVTGVSPAGILAGVTPVTATVDLAADLETLVGQFFTNRPAPLAPTFILSPAVVAQVHALDVGRDVTVNGGYLYGLPVVVSPWALANAIVVDAAVIHVADGGLDLDASKHVNVEMVDTSAAPTAATVFTSMFQGNMIAIRVERFIHWIVAAPNAVQYVAATGAVTTAGPKGDRVRAGRA